MRSRYEKLIQRYLDGMLDPSEVERVEELLRTNPEVSRLRREYESLNAAIKAMWQRELPPPPEDLDLGRLWQSSLSDGDASDPSAAISFVTRLRAVLLTGWRPLPALASGFAGLILGFVLTGPLLQSHESEQFAEPTGLLRGPPVGPPDAGAVAEAARLLEAATSLYDTGDLEQAAAVALGVLATYESILPPDDPRLYRVLRLLADVYHDRGDDNRAALFLRRAATTLEEPK